MPSITSCKFIRIFFLFFFSCLLGEATQQMGGEMDKDCGGTNNSMAANYTVNSGGKNDIGP